MTFTISWLKAASVRALRTAAQAMMAAIGTSAAIGEVNWELVISTAVLSAVLSFLTSVAGLPEVSDDE